MGLLKPPPPLIFLTFQIPLKCAKIRNLLAAIRETFDIMLGCERIAIADFMRKKDSCSLNELSGHCRRPGLCSNYSCGVNCKHGGSVA